MLLEFARRILHRVTRGDVLRSLIRNGLSVGDAFSMQEDVLIDPSHCWHITIGRNVTCAPGVHILAHDASTKIHLGYTRLGKVTIGDHVFLGASTIVLPGVDIGSNVVIGAGSVVTHDIPSNVVAAGNPARVICALDEFLERRRDEMRAVPTFGREYTIGGGVTDEMKQEMNARMTDRIGYVV